MKVASIKVVQLVKTPSFQEEKGPGYYHFEALPKKGWFSTLLARAYHDVSTGQLVFYTSN